MAITNADLLVVQQGNSVYKIEYGTVKGDVANTVRTTVSDFPPVNPVEGDLWWNEIEGQFFIYYTDINSSQWVSTSPIGGSSDLDIDSLPVLP